MSTKRKPKPRTWTKYERTIRHVVPAVAGWRAVYIAGIGSRDEDKPQMVTLPIAAFVIGSEMRWKVCGKRQYAYEHDEADDCVIGLMLFEDAGIDFMPKIEWLSRQWWEDVSMPAGVAAPGQDPLVVYKRALDTYKESQRNPLEER